MKFDWYEPKSQSNLIKHRVSFTEAITAFDDPSALIAPDEKHSTDAEERRWLIGESDVGILVVVFTVRLRGNIHRIISARPANRKERRLYEDRKELPL